MSLNRIDTDSLRWRTARRSVGNGACVEVAPICGEVLIRDSMDRTGPTIRYSGRSWSAFLATAKADRFDLVGK